MKNRFLSLLALLVSCVCGMRAADVYDGYTISNEGAWCWFADPRALHYENEAGTINASYLGYIDVHGNIKAMQYDFLSGRSHEVLIRSYFQPDDHNNPTFLVLPDERIMIFYSRHTDEACFFYRVSRQPGDITTLGEEKVIRTANNTTYPSPFILSDDPQHFYLCWRGVNWHPTIGRYTLPDADDNVATAWGPYQIVQSTGARPYAKYYSNGKDKIYMTYTTGHPDNELPNWVYFNAVNLNATTASDGNVNVTPTLEDIRGTRLSNIASGPFKVYKTSDYKNQYPYTVVDAPADYRDWVWQTALDAQGRPVIAMVRINGGKSQHEYFYAKWTGSAWRLTDLADGGGRFHSSNTEYCYSGGEALDPENPNVIYLSIPTAGESGQKVYEIWKYTLDDDGRVTEKTPVTRNSASNNVRPYVLPSSSRSPLRLGWMNGDYYYWMVKKDYPQGYPTALHCDYEWQEALRPVADAPAVSLDYAWRPMTAADSETPQLPASEVFTLSVDLALSPAVYHGTLLTTDAFAVGVGETDALPYIIIGGERYTSTNQLYTSDNWATNSSGTNGDRWPTPLPTLNLTLAYDGARLAVYRNGLLDQLIPAVGLTASGLRLGGYEGALGGMVYYTECLTQAELKHSLSIRALDALYVPSRVVTDLVLPTRMGGEAVAWTSSAPELIASDGTFCAPEAETAVRLTATTASATRTFDVVACSRDIAANLLAHYAFEADDVTVEADGRTIVADLSGCGRHLTLCGSARADGVLDLTANRPAAFDSNGYAIVPAGLLDSLRSYTVMFQATSASLSSAPRFYDFGFSSGNSLFGRANTLAAGIKLGGGTTTMVSAATQLQAGITYRLAVTYDARTRRTTLYVDGIPVGSGTDNVNEAWQIAAAGADVRNYVGRTQWWDTSYAADNVDYVGTMDELRIYNTALSLGEIAALQGIHIDDESLNIDCTAALVNPDFERTFSVLPASGVTDDRAIYVPEGWTVDYTGRDRNDLTALNASCLYYDLFASVAKPVELGTASYLVRQKWGNSSIGLRQECDTLQAAYYALQASLWQSGLGGQATIWAQMADEAPQSATAPSATGAWERATVMVPCDGLQTLTFGFTALHTSDGSEKLLGVDNFALLDVTANRQADELVSLLSRMTLAAESLMADETLPETYRTELAEASREATAVNGGDDRDTVYTIYCRLRDAIRAARNPLSTGIGRVYNGAEVAQGSAVIYSLDGRRLAASPEQLPRGVYLVDGHKKVVK
ncbi:MAG: BNR-4 repeat-containing protein [Clostridium sp.]|nr:BNR-4 repeat-containing protein [Clostridium sp.]